MKIWKEFEEDVFLYFKWFSKSEAVKKIEKAPNLSVLSINGSMLFENDSKSNFIDVCAKEINKIFTKLDNNYNFYLFANVEIKDKNSKVGKYKKIWKLLQSKWEIDKFDFGQEIEMEIEGRVFYSSIARFCHENVSTALKLVSSDPRRYTIIASKEEDIMAEESIRSIFGIAFTKFNDYIDEIDYFSLCVHLCKRGDVVFRWGDTSEEAEVAMVFNKKMINFRKDEIIS